MHVDSIPSILYFGTPVTLVSTKNDNGTDNLAPISSIFWLGWRCVIGISAVSKTTENLLRTGECVLNMPSVNEVAGVNRLARTTGSNPISPSKQQKGYFFHEDKFGISGFHPLPSLVVKPPRVKECPVQLEAEVAITHGLSDNDPVMKGRIRLFELRIRKVHLEQSILMEDNPSRVDPDKWRPLIMSFQEFYGLGEKLHYSTLGEIDEQLYRTPEVPVPLTCPAESQAI